MTALSITKANVVLVSGTPLVDQIAGEAFDAGDCVYLANDNTWLKAKCNGTAIQAGANRLALSLATCDAVGARVSLAGDGCVVGLGTGTAGIHYVPGTTAGDLIPTADLASTNKSVPFAVGIGSNRIQIQRNYNAGAALA
jgi:hypothetical protein